MLCHLLPKASHIPPLRTHTPEEIEQARILYEQTDLSPKDVARLLGISANTFWRRVGAWGWRKRRLRVAEVDAMARRAAASRDATLAAMGTKILDETRSAAERAEAAILAQISALEITQERVALAALTVLDGERAGRALHSLARALASVRKLREPVPGRPSGEDEEDAAALRAEIIRRVRIVAARERGEAPEARSAEPPEPPAPTPPRRVPRGTPRIRRL